MPVGWEGLDLLNVSLVSDAAILDYYGEEISIPMPPTDQVWLGRANDSWDNPSNWLCGEIPDGSDTIRINSCACPEASYVMLLAGVTTIGGMRVSEGGEVTVPAGSVLNINGLLDNRGVMIVNGAVNITAGALAVMNRGTIDCRMGGSIVIME